MAHRQEVVCPLDVGRHSFNDFLHERLEALQKDLLRECNRIADARELILKRQLSETRMQYEEVQAKLDMITKGTADSLPQVNDDQRFVSHETNPALQNIGEPVPAHHDILQDSVITRQNSSKSTLSGNNAKSDLLVLWSEWQQCNDAADQIEEFHDELAWEHEANQEGMADMFVSPGVLDPHSRLSLGWEIIGIPVLFYDLVTIPMQVFDSFEGVAFDIIGWILIVYWSLDMILRLLIIGQFNEDGTIQLNRKVVMKMYMKKSFAFDFFMVAPDWFSKVAGSGGFRNVAILRLFRILRLMRLMRMSKMKKIMRDFEDIIDSEYFTVFVSICCNLASILATCHYLGCFWFFVGKIEVPGYQSWVDAEVADEVWEYQYVVSLLWAVAQFTPGSSGIEPRNILEASASILVLILGLVFLSMFISALAQARARLQALTSQMERDNWMLRRYLRQQGVPVDLQIRTMKYVEKCLEPMMTRVQRKDVHLLPLLSRPLQLEVQEEEYFHTLTAHPFFQQLRARSLGLTLTLFVNVIIDVLLADLDMLFEAGSVSHEMYFVSRGSVAYHPPPGTGKVEYLHRGGWCCEHVLWVPWVHNGTSKAVLESHVISIDSAKMRAAVLEHSQRRYVSRVASGYLMELNALAEQGKPINDLTRIKDDDSCYFQAIRGESQSPQKSPTLGSNDVIAASDGASVSQSYVKI